MGIHPKAQKRIPAQDTSRAGSLGNRLQVPQEQATPLFSAIQNEVSLFTTQGVQTLARLFGSLSKDRHPLLTLYGVGETTSSWNRATQALTFLGQFATVPTAPYHTAHLISPSLLGCRFSLCGPGFVPFLPDTLHSLGLTLGF